MKQTLLFCGIAMAGLSAVASPLSPEQALDRLNQDSRQKVRSSELVTVPVYVQRADSGQPTLYVFNNKDNSGFRILSADDSAYAVLGYSDSGAFDADDMSPEARWWLGEMSRQVSYAASLGLDCGISPAVSAYDAIEPLCLTKWNQDDPYNNMAPTIGGRRCYTGCVATSMAQLMKYHNYPEKGEGSISYSWDGSSTGSLSMDFSDVVFDWDDMKDVYLRNRYTAKEAKAVAELMKACGYSTRMNYGTNASGTQGQLIANALKKYFGYDAGTRVEVQVIYSQSEWTKMVWENLKNVGPVVFNGHPVNDGGHSFICDGYDGKGYFHFNWGWGGLSDGYYLLSCMDPEAQGIGGSSGGGFNYSLNGIFGAQKPTGQEVAPQPDNLLMYGGCTAEISKENVTIKQTPWYPSGWVNATDHNIEVNCGVIISPIDGTEGKDISKAGYLGGMLRVNLNPGTYYNSSVSLTVTLPTLANGKYKVTVATRNLAKGAENVYIPILCPYGMPNYFYLTVEGSNYSVENAVIPSLQPEDLVLDSPLYFGRMAKYVAKLKNNSEYELTRSISPALLKDGKVVMVGYIVPTTLEPNSVSDVEWPATMKCVNGFAKPRETAEFQLAVVDPVTMEILGSYGNVTMEPQPLQYAQLVNKGFSIEGIEPEEEQNDDFGRLLVYNVPNGNFTASLTVEVARAFFDGVITVSVYKPNPESVNNPDPVEMGIFQVQPFMEEYDSKTFEIPVNMTEYDPKDIYMLRVDYTRGNANNVLTNLYFRPQESGVNIIESEIGEARFYNLQGMEIKNPKKGEVLIMVKNGKSAKVMF